MNIHNIDKHVSNKKPLWVCSCRAVYFMVPLNMKRAAPLVSRHNPSVPAQPWVPAGFYHSSFPVAPVSTSNAQPRMKNEKINWIRQGSSWQTKGIGKKKGRENHYWPSSIARTLAGEKGAKISLFISSGRRKLRGRLRASAGASTVGSGAPCYRWVGFTSVLPCQCRQRFLPAETEPNHVRWSQIKLPGDFCGLHRWSGGQEWNSPMESPRPQTGWEPHSSTDPAAVMQCLWREPEPWEPQGSGKVGERKEKRGRLPAGQTCIVLLFPRPFVSADHLPCNPQNHLQMHQRIPFAF